jgi:hypothetical protein
MNQKFMVYVMGLVLLATIPILTQAQEQEEERPLDLSGPGALPNMKKMQDILDTCDAKFNAEGSVDESTKNDCFAVIQAFNQQMGQLFNQHKESIDDIL